MTVNTELPRLSIIIPAYNESGRILGTLESIKSYMNKQDYAFTALIVNDGSTDNTLQLCEEFAIENNWLQILSYDENKGKGYAVREGMMHASSEYMLLCDADLSTPIEELDNFWTYMDEGADIVIASRPLKESSLLRRQPIYREMAGRMLNRYIRMIVVPGIKDTQCGFKLFRAAAAKEIFQICRINGFSFDIEALYIARKKHYAIKEAPVHWYHRAGSKVRLLQDGFRMLYDTIKIRIMHHRVKQ